MMKVRALAILSVVALLLCGCSTLPSNEIPMYGEALKSPWVQKLNQEFVGQAVKECGNKEKASDAYVQHGWAYYDRNDLSTAMKRFNQAWLLNTNNAGAYQGMGVVVGQRANTESDIQQSIKLLETASAKAPADGRIMIDLACSHMGLGAFRKIKFNSKDDTEFFKAEALLEEATKTLPTNSFLYYNWAVLELDRGNYTKAKTKLDEAVRLGCKPNPYFLKDMDRLKKWTEANKGK